jgi:LysR family transcriptional regulator (chromosome initiation inhibitor)
MNFDRQQLEAFAAVVEIQHFGRAARVLNITRGAVSQRIKTLEERLGMPLLMREGNVPTSAGEVLLRHIQMLRLLEADTLQQLKPTGKAQSRIAIAVNADSLATWFEPVAWAIAKQNIGLEILVEHQDFTLPLLARGEAIGCVSTEANPLTGFRAESVGSMEYACVANPKFSQTHFSKGLNLHDILAAPVVLINRKDRLHAEFVERLLGFGVNGYAMNYFPSPAALLSAIRAGVGYGLMPSVLAQPLIDSGEIEVLAPYHKMFVNLYWHRWEAAPSHTQAINELVMRHARQALVQHSGIGV